MTCDSHALFRNTFLILFLLLTAWITTIPAQQNSVPAQDDSAAVPVDTVVYELNEIVITGTRYNKKVIDIPYSVVRIDNSQFQYQRKVAISDVLGTVPGLFMQSRYGNHDVRISIRGFGSRSNTGIRGVRILLDGIPESEPDGQTRIEAIDFNSVGRIEVLKGNSSSLYTNAPGGVVNFINDIYYPQTFAVNFNDFGSFDLRRNGFKAGVKTDKYRYLLTYSYHNYLGYRKHSEDFWNIVNSVFETTPTAHSNLQVLGYYVDGLIRLPGSLTWEEFQQDPFQAAPREVDFDFRRISKKGRLGLRFNNYFGRNENNEIEITTYGTIKYFERASRIYRIINRYGLGASFRFVNKSRISGRQNEFSFGGDLLYQTGPIESYDNLNGRKSDILTGLTNESISNVGFFFQNSISLYRERLFALLSGRYDKVVFNQKNQLLAAQNDARRFEAFTPKLALNYKLSPFVAVYTSIGKSFDTPAGNELDNFPISSDPGKLINPDLKPQNSRNFELGIKANVVQRGSAFLNNAYIEATFFNSLVDDEVVPFEVFTDVFFRNSARTGRNGLEFGFNADLYRGLSWKLAYTFSDFNYDRYTAETVEIDNTGNLVITGRDFSGNTVPSVPRHNLSTALSYQQQLSRGKTVFMRGSYQNVSGMWVDDANSDRTDGYRVVGASIGVDLVFGRFNLLASGGVDNLFDSRYVGFININSTNGRFYEAGSPRSYFGNVRLGLLF